MKKYHKIFKTDWGYAKVIFDKTKIYKFILPSKVSPALPILSFLQRLIYLPYTDYHSLWINNFCEDVKRYFQGKKVNFNKYKIDLTEHTLKERKVLKVLRKIKYGDCISYKQLAIMASLKDGARFVGNVMAKNKLPLLIPCHRVIKSDGTIGNFGYGKTYKQKLLLLERIYIRSKFHR